MLTRRARPVSYTHLDVYKRQASRTEAQTRDVIVETTGIDTGDFHFGVDPDQLGRLAADVEAVRSHPLIGPYAKVAGFLYDVETGLLERQV